MSQNETQSFYENSFEQIKTTVQRRLAYFTR